MTQLSENISPLLSTGPEEVDRLRPRGRLPRRTGRGDAARRAVRSAATQDEQGPPVAGREARAHDPEPRRPLTPGRSGTPSVGAREAGAQAGRGSRAHAPRPGRAAAPGTEARARAGCACACARRARRGVCTRAGGGRRPGAHAHRGAEAGGVPGSGERCGRPSLLLAGGRRKHQRPRKFPLRLREAECVQGTERSAPRRGVADRRSSVRRSAVAAVRNCRRRPRSPPWFLRPAVAGCAGFCLTVERSWLSEFNGVDANYQESHGRNPGPWGFARSLPSLNIHTLMSSV
ncbi:uncharacterized protein [Equus caballus]|uniref:uncharacterized protein n=1 Tax=Equus caballus TaxID=9796 RepID=UPI0038B33338